VTNSFQNSWKQRADYLMELLRTGILKGMEQEIGHVLISIVKGTAQAICSVYKITIIQSFYKSTYTFIN
jgi:hypothetical protein